MENINLEATACTPLVEFHTNGQLTLKGRSFPKQIQELYNPLIDFVSQLTCQSVTLEIDLEYINSASTKKILELLQTIEANRQIKDISVHWYFEEGDEDSLEVAEIYAGHLSRTHFTFNEYAEM